MSQRYQQMFNTLQQEKQVAWIPFMMLGYPTIEHCESLIETLIESGADALELGIPFSDPVADGPIIQEAARVALENGTKVADCFALIERIRSRYPTIPMGLLVYANLVYRPGVNNFYASAAKAGVDSVLVADMPTLEAKRFADVAMAHEIDPVFIAPPNADEASLKRLVTYCRGYTYVVSRPGVTGNHQEVEYPEQVLLQLKTLSAPPAVLGFGISKPEHVQLAVNAGFDGVISGSAVVRIVLDSGQLCADELSAFSRQMKAACARGTHD